MAEENNHPQKPQGPICSFCDSPLNFGDGVVITPGGYQIHVSWCAVCGKTLNLQCLGKKSVVVADPTSKTGRGIVLG